MAWIRSGKLMPSATPGMPSSPEWMLPVPGFGNRKPAGSPMRGRIRKVSRSRLPTCAPSWPLNPTPSKTKSIPVSPMITIGFSSLLHAYWDTSAAVQDAGMQKMPLGKGSAEKVVVKYPSVLGGYTPGDTWELYVGKDNRVQEFIYRRGGSVKPSVVVATWADYKKAGPLSISTDHHGTADGKPLRVFVSGLAVKVKGTDTWMEAK